MPKGTLWIVTVSLAMAMLLAAPAVAQEAKPAGEPERLTTPAEVDQAQPAPSGGGQAAPKDDQAKQDKPPPQQQPKGMLDNWPLLVMIGGLILLWVWMGRGRKKEQQKRADMLSALKKGDKITTIGGIIGTVIEVRPEDVLVKVDESANVRMHFARWAIRGVGDAGKADSPNEGEQKR